jgi:hypothetical protein
VRRFSGAWRGVSVVALASAMGVACAGAGEAAADAQPADVLDVVVADTVGGGDTDLSGDGTEQVCEAKTSFCVNLYESALCDAEGTGLAYSMVCPGAQVCDDATGLCALQVCDSTVLQCISEQSFHPCAEGGFQWSEAVEDCGEDFLCLEDRCVFCPYGLNYCEDINTVGRCDRGVQTYVFEACPEGLQCQEQTGSCGPVVCIPGAEACLDESSPTVCLPSGTSWDLSLEACPEGQLCQEGQCLFCPQGLAYCPGPTTLALCDPDTLSYVEQPCPEGSLCDGIAGVCVASTCEPGITCLDLHTFEGCMEDGATAYTATCPEDHLCLQDECHFCPNGEGYCLSETVGATCDPETGTYLELSCTGADQCHEPTGDCLPPICQPGETHCETKLVVSSCYPSGTDFAKTICPDGELCLGSSCVPCPHGEQYCIGPVTAGTCDPELGGYMEQTCSPGLACNGYLGECVPLSCEEDEEVCLNTMEHYQCPGEGTVDWDEVPVDSCGPSFQCSFGACVFEPCMVEVVLLIDRSGSMDNSWGEVLESVQALTDMEKDVIYGFAFFPNKLGMVSTEPDVPVGQVRNKGELAMVFDAFVPVGGTPLVQAMQAVADNADNFFTTPEEGYLVVLSDGKAQYSGDAPAALAQSTTQLYVEHGVRTYVIGYDYTANPEELVAIAENGATTTNAYLIANGGLELTEALFGIAGDIKLCSD